MKSDWICGRVAVLRAIFSMVLGVWALPARAAVLDGAPGLRAATAWSWRSRAQPFCNY